MNRFWNIFFHITRRFLCLSCHGQTRNLRQKSCRAGSADRLYGRRFSNAGKEDIRWIFWTVRSCLGRKQESAALWMAFIPMIWDFTGSRRGFLEKYMRFSLDIFGREWYLNFNTTAASCCNMTNAKIRISTDSYRISESRWLV